MFILNDVLRATDGKLISGMETARINGVSIDSRTIKKGMLFIAIKGRNFDGHDFVHEVAQRAAAIVVSCPEVPGDIGIPVIRVKDTTRALGDLAAFHRRRFSIPVIAVTGSAGKTTTKELIACVLKPRYRVLKNYYNHNNLIGVPLTLLRLTRGHDIAVVELGTNMPGEIKRLAQIAWPTVSVLTNVGESHLEFLKSPQGVFEEKFSIVTEMMPGGTVIFNGDDAYLKKIPARKIKPRTINYGLGNHADLKANKISLGEKRYYDFWLKRQRYRINSTALHMVYNALAALACGRLLKVPYRQMAGALGRFKSLDNRFQLSRIGPYALIDDTYNSNPVSLRSAIQSLRNFRHSGKKIFICGDMLELGKESRRLHQEMGRLLTDSPVDVLLTVGKDARYLSQSAAEKGRMCVRHCEDLQSARNCLLEYLKAGDMIFLKGSRGVHLEKLVEFIKERARE